MSYSQKFINSAKLYMEMALTVSKFSKALRRQVGAIIVSSEGKIIGTGFNGAPSGVDNSCEDANGVTFPYVIHAEQNAIFNSTTHKLDHSTLFVTDSPCMHCASSIIQKKIKTVVYERPYRDMEGIKFLQKHGVDVVSMIELNSILDSIDESSASQLRFNTKRHEEIINSLGINNNVE